MALAADWQHIDIRHQKELLSKSIIAAAEARRLGGARGGGRGRGDDETSSRGDASSRTSGANARDQWDVMSVPELMRERAMFQHLGLLERAVRRAFAAEAHGRLARDLS